MTGPARAAAASAAQPSRCTIPGANAGFTDTMVITGWDPPQRCVVRHTGRVVRGEGLFEVVPAGAGSEFRWTERLDLPLGVAGRWGWRLVRPLAQRGMDTSVRRFARFVSAGAPR